MAGLDHYHQPCPRFPEQNISIMRLPALLSSTIVAWTSRDAVRTVPG